MPTKRGCPRCPCGNFTVPRTAATPRNIGVSQYHPGVPWRISPIVVYGTASRPATFNLRADAVAATLAGEGPAGRRARSSHGGGSRVSVKPFSPCWRIPRRTDRREHQPPQAGDVSHTWATRRRAKDYPGFAPEFFLREGFWPARGGMAQGVDGALSRRRQRVELAPYSPRRSPDPILFLASDGRVLHHGGVHQRQRRLIHDVDRPRRLEIRETSSIAQATQKDPDARRRHPS